MFIKPNREKPKQPKSAQPANPDAANMKPFDLDQLSRDYVLEHEKIRILSYDEVIEQGKVFGEDLWWDRNYGYYICDFSNDEAGRDDEGTYFTGLAFELYENGNLSYYQYYKDGLQDGEDVEFFPSGAVQHYGVWKDTKSITGNYYTWFESGQIRKYTFRNPSTRLYETYEWYESGRVMLHSFRTKSAGVEQTYEWYENGKIKSYESCDNRGCLLKRTRYDEDGKVTEQFKRP